MSKTSANLVNHPVQPPSPASASSSLYEYYLGLQTLNGWLRQN